ncbi:uncharacterized protein LOC133360736 isoform X4 [Lethenteron reissneri]|uniref:uncharacterized protein LOC133360736 isoform X4 n=1 Tax=Lethenteron reissneri TaxID=7753 RepID=UPI002AB6B08B|nr:uncharacterized protein LOC133360736 isoform X4 [Lethenteron reissneri]
MSSAPTSRNSRKGLKYKSLSLRDKSKVLDRIDAGVPMRMVCEEFDIKSSTFYDIKKGREKIRKHALTLEDPSGSKRVQKRIKATKFVDLDSAVYKWYKQERAAGVNVRGVDIRHAAVHLAQCLRIQDFNASASWLFNFRSRHCLGNRQVVGESASADQASVDPFRKCLVEIIEESQLLMAQMVSHVELPFIKQEHDETPSPRMYPDVTVKLDAGPAVKEEDGGSLGTDMMNIALKTEVDDDGPYLKIEGISERPEELEDSHECLAASDQNFIEVELSEEDNCQAEEEKETELLCEDCGKGSCLEIKTDKAECTSNKTPQACKQCGKGRPRESIHRPHFDNNGHTRNLEMNLASASSFIQYKSPTGLSATPAHVFFPHPGNLDTASSAAHGSPWTDLETFAMLKIIEDNPDISSKINSPPGLHKGGLFVKIQKELLKKGIRRYPRQIQLRWRRMMIDYAFWNKEENKGKGRKLRSYMKVFVKLRGLPDLDENDVYSLESTTKNALEMSVGEPPEVEQKSKTVVQDNFNLAEMEERIKSEMNKKIEDKFAETFKHVNSCLKFIVERQNSMNSRLEKIEFSLANLPVGDVERVDNQRDLGRGIISSAAMSMPEIDLAKRITRQPADKRKGGAHKKCVARIHPKKQAKKQAATEQISKKRKLHEFEQPLEQTKTVDTCVANLTSNNTRGKTGAQTKTSAQLQ